MSSARNGSSPAAVDPVPTTHATLPVQATPPPATLMPHTHVLCDTFADTRRAGRVLGTRATPEAGPGPAHARLGADAEGVLAVDNGALRIQPLVVPNWGRSGIAYGPFKREPGLTLAVCALNGHNLSQTYRLESFLRIVKRWVEASKTDPIPLRMFRYALFHRPRQSLLRKMRCWFRAYRVGHRPRLNENLAIGWFPKPAPSQPLVGGNALVVHGPRDLNNGELWASIDGTGLSAFRSFMNLPVLYVVSLRERGAAYYAASLPGARGPGAYPSMRPLAIDPFAEEDELYAGVHQSVLGEVGWGVDTRVFSVKADHVPGLIPWFGSAHAADALAEGLPLAGTEAEAGGLWRVMPASPGRGTIALLDPPGPSPETGLVHALIDLRAVAESQDPDMGGEGSVGLVWRAADAASAWLLTFADGRCTLQVRDRGAVTVIAVGEVDMQRGRPSSVQVLDDGRSIVATIDGRSIFGRTIRDERLAGQTGVGLVLGGGAASRAITRFEAHPRHVPIPPTLDPGPFWKECGERLVAHDSFDGPPGELDGRRTADGQHTWQRIFGPGRFDITGRGTARVRADLAKPCPGRTFYTIEWRHPSFAHLDITLTPPGTGPFQRHHSRAGVVFWQDPKNYLLVCLWLDHGTLPTAVSTFICLDGFEDIHDSVWSCIGLRHDRWTQPLPVNVAFDGMRWLAHAEGEPIFYRSLTDIYPRCKPLRINRVGLATTWEWGLDTGTTFHDFRARTRP